MDKEIAGVIIKAPIRQPEIAGANKIKRDPATNLPLDDEGRYAQQISVNGKMHAPKYFPCPTASAGCGGQNLDMSDPGTVAYVKALDQKVFDDIGTGSTYAALINPIGAIGFMATIVGAASSVGSGYVQGKPIGGLANVALQQTAQQYLQRIYGLGEAAASRVVSLVDLGGGWKALADRVQKYPNTREDK